MESKIKKIIAILLAVCFLVSLTASSAAAGHGGHGGFDVQGGGLKQVINKPQTIEPGPENYNSNSYGQERTQPQTQACGGFGGFGFAGSNEGWGGIIPD